jgi:hypothetical protein
VLSLTRGRICSLKLLLALASLVILATTFYCLIFETSLFVCSYDSLGYGGGIRPRIFCKLLYALYLRENRREITASKGSSTVFLRCAGYHVLIPRNALIPVFVAARYVAKICCLATVYSASPRESSQQSPCLHMTILWLPGATSLYVH